MPPLDPKAETLLVARCAAGEAAAWDEFVAAYGTLVRDLARRMLSRGPAAAQDADVDEVCGEVFLALLRHDRRLLRRYDPTWRLSTWLGVICRSAAARLGRRRRPQLLADPEEAAAGRACEPDPAAGLLAEERREALDRLRQGLLRLGERDRLLLTLRFLDGRSYREIAAALELNPQSVGQLLSRAKARLAELLPDWSAGRGPHAGG